MTRYWLVVCCALVLAVLQAHGFGMQCPNEHNEFEYSEEMLTLESESPRPWWAFWRAWQPLGAQSQLIFSLNKNKRKNSNKGRDNESLAKPLPNLKIAFIADQGLGGDPRKVLRMIKEWGAKAVIHNGDFDYKDNPRKWIRQIDSVLGPDFPYFATIGNHDLVRWKGRNGYKHLMVDRLYRTKMNKHCRGDYGVNMECNFHGLHLVFSGIGTRGTGHANFAEDVLSRSNKIWRICNWHKNQHLFQTGDKKDETGYEIYEVCRRFGAIIATAHEHSYSRTHLMASFESQVIASNGTLEVRPGHTFAFVNGLGGEDIRPWVGGLEKNPWWAVTASSDNGVGFGALLCEFYVDGREDKARCVFRDTNGKTWDDFEVYSSPNEPAIEAFTKQRSHYREYPVRSPSHIQTPDSPSRADRLRIASKQCSSFSIRFAASNHTALSSSEEVGHSHLQLLLLPTSLNAPLTDPRTVRIVLHNQHHTTLNFTEKISEYEPGEIWVSPDVSSLLVPGEEVVVFGKGCIEGEGEGTIDAYAWGDRGCFAPTLVHPKKTLKKKRSTPILYDSLKISSPR
ncbi:uncharacterized protein VTP21DRAFT_6280 [Calcarisporiella thermophila]|uniref:uncharacterized protein n=1 Tax=Calcarisporiella thermophila TaxID=911321 RepID=UPI0037437FC4